MDETGYVPPLDVTESGGENEADTQPSIEDSESSRLDDGLDTVDRKSDGASGTDSVGNVVGAVDTSSSMDPESEIAAAASDMEQGEPASLETTTDGAEGLEEDPYAVLKSAYMKRPSVGSSYSNDTLSLVRASTHLGDTGSDPQHRGSLVALKDGRPGAYSGYEKKKRTAPTNDGDVSTTRTASVGEDDNQKLVTALQKPRASSAPLEPQPHSQQRTEPVRPPRKSKPKSNSTERNSNSAYDKLWSYVSRSPRKSRKVDDELYSTPCEDTQAEEPRLYDAVFEEGDGMDTFPDGSATNVDHQFVETGIRVSNPMDRDKQRPSSAVILPLSLNEEMLSDADSWGSDFDETLEQADDNEIYDVIGQDQSLKMPAEDSDIYEPLESGHSPCPPTPPPRNSQCFTTAEEEDKILYVEINMASMMGPPLRLPSLKAGSTREEIKRYQIIKCILENEKLYMLTVHKLIDQYERPLKERAIISQEKIKTIFQHLHEIQQCHQLFNIALSGRMSEWDTNPTIGDIVYSSFSKSMLVEAYSKYVQNFTNAMDSVKETCLLVPAFFNFLKSRLAKNRVKQSLYDLLRQPLERVPQLVILVQELLKVSPSPSPDRVPLQMALTQLEGLAEVLSEEKRNTTMRHKVQQLDKYFIGMNKALFSSKRYYTRHDDMHLCVVENGKVVKTKLRRLFMLSDRLICASLINRTKKMKHISNKRYKVKWCVPILDVDIAEMGSGISVHIENKTTTIQYSGTSPRPSNKSAQEKLENMQHDLAVIGQISGLAASLRTFYNVISKDSIDELYRKVKEKLELETEIANMHWLELRLPTKDSNASFLFNIPSSKVKLEWTSELENAKLRLSCDNNPGWYLPGNELSSCGSIAVLRKNLPLLTQTLPLFMIEPKFVVECMIEVPVREKKDPVVWMFSGHEHGGQISIMSMSMGSVPRITEAFVATNSRILTAEIAMGKSATGGKDTAKPVVWVGTMSGSLIIYDAESPDRQITAVLLQQRDSVVCLRRIENVMFAGLANGMLSCFRQKADGVWDLQNPTVICLDSSPVLSMTAAAGHLWCACGNTIHVLNSATLGAEHHIEVGTNPKQFVKHLVTFGSGVWVSTWKSCRLQLYHAETYDCLQTLNVSSPISRMKNDIDGRIQNIAVEKVHITSLRACEGLLWVGTSVGLILSYRLPRLGGVPLVSGSAFVSFHGHEGPVRCLYAFRLRTDLKNYIQNEAVQRKSIFYTGLDNSGLSDSLRDVHSTLPRDSDSPEPVYFMVEPERTKSGPKSIPKTNGEMTAGNVSSLDSYNQWLKSFGTTPEQIDPFAKSYNEFDGEEKTRGYNSDDSIDSDQEFSFIEDKTSVDPLSRRSNATKSTSTFISVDINRETTTEGRSAVVSGDVTSKTNVGGLDVVPEATNFADLMSDFAGFEDDGPKSSTPTKAVAESNDDDYETALSIERQLSTQSIPSASSDMNRHYKYAPLPSPPRQMIDGEIMVVSTPEIVKPRLLDLIKSADSTLSHDSSSLSVVEQENSEQSTPVVVVDAPVVVVDAPTPVVVVDAPVVVADAAANVEEVTSTEAEKVDDECTEDNPDQTDHVSTIGDNADPTVEYAAACKESVLPLPTIDVDRANAVESSAADEDRVYTPLISQPPSIVSRQDESFDGAGVRDYDNEVALSASLVRDSPEKYYATLMSVAMQDDKMREGLLLSPLYFVSVGCGRVDLKKKAKSAGIEKLKSLVTSDADPEMLIWKVTS